MDTAIHTVSATIPVGASPVQVAVAPNGREAYVSLGQDSAVVKVDLVQQQVSGLVEVPSAPVQVYLTADGTRLLSANQGSEDDPGNTVSVIDLTTQTVVATVPVGEMPNGVSYGSQEPANGPASTRITVTDYAQQAEEHTGGEEGEGAHQH